MPISLRAIEGCRSAEKDAVGRHGLDDRIPACDETKSIVERSCAQRARSPFLYPSVRVASAHHSRVGRLRRSVFSLHGKSGVDQEVSLLLNQILRRVAISTIEGWCIWSLTYSLQSAVSGWNWDHANQNA